MGATLSVLFVLVECGAGTTVSRGDAGSDGASPGTDGGADTGTDGASFAKCARNASLDTDCVAKYGATAAKGWSCTDVFFNPPPCQPMDTLGCTEVCETRCCP